MGETKKGGKEASIEIFHSPNSETTKLETTMCQTSVQAIDFIIKCKYANHHDAMHYYERPF